MVIKNEDFSIKNRRIEKGMNEHAENLAYVLKKIVVWFDGFYLFYNMQNRSRSMECEILKVLRLDYLK